MKRHVLLKWLCAAECDARSAGNRLRTSWRGTCSAVTVRSRPVPLDRRWKAVPERRKGHQRDSCRHNGAGERKHSTRRPETAEYHWRDAFRSGDQGQRGILTPVSGRVRLNWFSAVPRPVRAHDIQHPSIAAIHVAARQEWRRPETADSTATGPYEVTAMSRSPTPPHCRWQGARRRRILPVHQPPAAARPAAHVGANDRGVVRRQGALRHRLGASCCSHRYCTGTHST